ncbi:calcineurin-like phosphoesterase C-terminal domain-containing protein [Bacteroides thetaiotaomicron]|nr:calcineurin-like phosphoesterase C-terminal domain-containing protein [Bacteroides thetaiotaomicron]
MIANVWNWDDLWKVEWYENGQRMGEMQKYKDMILWQKPSVRIRKR